VVDRIGSIRIAYVEDDFNMHLDSNQVVETLKTFAQLTTNQSRKSWLTHALARDRYALR
jgi:hypothetical protein